MGFSVFILTWNVDGNVARGGELQELLRRSPAPDIYVIGLQELEQSQPQRSFYSSRTVGRGNEKEAEWENCLSSILSDYAKLSIFKLDGIALFIYVQQSLLPLVENLEEKSCAFYSRHENGAKGAIAASFEMGGFSFCFVNCHLSSKSESFEKRDQEFHLIWDVLKFPSGNFIHDHDHVFMLGILNERAEPGENFEGFIEGEERDGRGPSKPLPPLGCDRILHRGSEAAKVEEYHAHPYYRMSSDHKPVTGSYRFSFPTFVEIKNSVAWNT